MKEVIWQSERWQICTNFCWLGGQFRRLEFPSSVPGSATFVHGVKENTKLLCSLEVIKNTPHPPLKQGETLANITKLPPPFTFS